ncbi:MAG TPA: hypothetical protein VF261_03190 [Candidatus Saccharimonadales bacterium]
MKKSALQAQKHKGYKKKWWALLYIVAALIVAAGIWRIVVGVRHTHAVNEERAQFVQAEKDLDTMSASIVAKFGQPEQNVKTRSCGYTSDPNEFSKGDLVCSTVQQIVYSAEFVNIEQFSRSVEESLPKILNPRGTYWSPAVTLNEPTPVTVGSSLFGGSTEVGCNVEYDYYVAKDAAIYGYPPLNASSGGLLISLDCSARPAAAAIFPLTE